MLLKPSYSIAAALGICYNVMDINIAYIKECTNESSSLNWWW